MRSLGNTKVRFEVNVACFLIAAREACSTEDANAQIAVRMVGMNTSIGNFLLYLRLRMARQLQDVESEKHFEYGGMPIN